MIAEALIRRLVADEVKAALEQLAASRNRAETEAVEGMSAGQAARFLGVDRKTVYDYANRGRIPHQKLGKRLLFSRSALVSWLRGWESSAPFRKGQ